MIASNQISHDNPLDRPAKYGDEQVTDQPPAEARSPPSPGYASRTLASSQRCKIRFKAARISLPSASPWLAESANSIFSPPSFSFVRVAVMPGIRYTRKTENGK